MRLRSRIRRLRDEDGLSIIEVVIGAALACVLAVSALAMLESSSRVAHSQQSRGDALVEVRAAMMRITKDTRQALSLSSTSTRNRIDMRTLDGGREVHVVYELSQGTLYRNSCVETSSGCAMPTQATPLTTNVTTPSVFCYDVPACESSAPRINPESVRVSLVVTPDGSDEPLTLTSEVALRNI